MNKMQELTPVQKDQRTPGKHTEANPVAMYLHFIHLLFW
jgi:hypothetical protein